MKYISVEQKRLKAPQKTPTQENEAYFNGCINCGTLQENDK